MDLAYSIGKVLGAGLAGRKNLVPFMLITVLTYSPLIALGSSREPDTAQLTPVL